MNYVLASILLVSNSATSFAEKKLVECEGIKLFDGEQINSYQDVRVRVVEKKGGEIYGSYSLFFHDHDRITTDVKVDKQNSYWLLRPVIEFYFPNYDLEAIEGVEVFHVDRKRLEASGEGVSLFKILSKNPEDEVKIIQYGSGVGVCIK